MPKFMFVFRGGGYASREQVSPTELQAHLGRWTDWIKEMTAAGRVVGSHPLAHPPTGKTIRGQLKAVTDGPYAESKDLVSGALVIEATSLDEATQLAHGCPILEHDSGSVEVRPLIG
jgi:hypothetical protein